MKTVKEVSDLTGISVRSLHYYDEIGLLKPSKITESGYRLYDDDALKLLQQILFFKELDIPLKDVKDIMESPHFNKMQSLANQKKLLILKRDRLNNLIDLIDRTLRGENDMSFKEFDMSEYFQVLEKFKHENKDKVIEMWGSIDKFDEFVKNAKDKEAKIAKGAIKEFGSIEKFTESINNNLNNINDNKMLKIANQYEEFKKDLLEDKNKKMTELFKVIAGYLNNDINSKEVIKAAEDITNEVKNDYELFSSDKGDECWYYMAKFFTVYPSWMKEVDKKFGVGTSKYIGTALMNYLEEKKPKGEVLFDDLTKDLSKDPCSNEIQKIVEEIDEENKRNAKEFNVENGDNHIGYMAEQYLTNKAVINSVDKEYGSGASRFIGEAFRYYSENHYKSKK